MSTKSSKKSYEPEERRNHSTVRVGDNLYMWGGFRTDFPEVHNSNEKRMKSSVVEVYHLPTGMWEQKLTTGNPPLGIHGYASAAIGNEIFYFGGDCNHQACYHNSLHSFNVKTLRWKELSPTTSHHGPMMKRDASMVAMRMYGEDYLVVIGGWGLSYNNTPKQPEAEYRGLDQVPDLQHCNEIHYYKLSSGEWISPLVKGDRPPPISHFTLASLSTDSVILFGGLNVTEWSNRLYFIKFSKGSLDISEIIPKKSSEWPQKRYAHSGVLINTIDFPEHLALPKENYKSGSYLLVVGGMNSEDCWLLDISNGTAKRFLNLPGAVTDRFYHSLSVWEISPYTYQIIEFGGGGQSSNTAISQLRRINHEWFFEANPMQPDLDLREKRKRKWSERQREETSQQFKKQSFERELEEEIRRREQATIRLRKDLQEREKQLRTTEESFWEVLHLVKDEKESVAQFEYLRPQLDLLDGDVVMAEKNLFLPLDETSSFRWKKYGFRFQCPQGAVPKGTKMAITALVGGNFILPKGTVLVSAVYAISVSKPLLKPLVIELQHCVDLRTNAQADCLKFVRAPLKSPYEFSLIDGGSFNVGRKYGSIKRDQFSLVAIVAEMSNQESASPSESGGSEENHDHETSNQDFIEEMVTEAASNEAMVGHAEAIAETRLIGDQPTSASQTESLVQIESNNYVNRSDIWYTGMMYHKRRDTGYWITMYTAVKDLDAMLQHVVNNYPNAERDGVNVFKFNQRPNGIMKLTLGIPHETGWIVHPHQRTMELYQSVIDRMQSPMVSTIQVSVYAESGITNMPLHCPIELTGINPSNTIFINRLPPPPITITTGSSSINFDSVRAIPESRREKACEAITNSTGTIKDALDLGTLANKLLENRIINEREQRAVLDDRTGLTTDQRMDKLLSLVKTTIRLDGNTFLLFIQIITEEDNIRADIIAKRLIEYYNNN